MMLDVGLQYRQHLTESDLDLLRRVTGRADDLERAFCHPDLERAVFGAAVPGSIHEALSGPSPFLAFCIAVCQTATRIEHTSFVEERWAPRVRVPVFDVAPLRAFLSSPLRRFFLVELLSSYTRVSSGTTWTKTRRGWRKRRFSELDPTRLVELLEVTDSSEHVGIYRRLGDLSLFLSGVFPDHTALHGLNGLAAARLVRHAGLPAGGGMSAQGTALLEELGPRWYHLATTALQRSGLPPAALGAAAEMSELFTPARRVLNLVADRYLFPLRDQWFGGF